MTNLKRLLGFFTLAGAHLQNFIITVVLVEGKASASRGDVGGRAGGVDVRIVLIGVLQAIAEAAWESRKREKNESELEHHTRLSALTSPLRALSRLVDVHIVSGARLVETRAFSPAKTLCSVLWRVHAQRRVPGRKEVLLGLLVQTIVVPRIPSPLAAMAERAIVE